MTDQNEHVVKDTVILRRTENGNYFIAAEFLVPAAEDGTNGVGAYFSPDGAILRLSYGWSWEIRTLTTVGVGDVPGRVLDAYCRLAAYHDLPVHAVSSVVEETHRRNVDFRLISNGGDYTLWTVYTLLVDPFGRMHVAEEERTTCEIGRYSYTGRYIADSSEASTIELRGCIPPLKRVVEHDTPDSEQLDPLDFAYPVGLDDWEKIIADADN